MSARLKILCSDFMLAIPAFHLFRPARQNAALRRHMPFRDAGTMCSRLNQSPTGAERPPRATARGEVGETLENLGDGRQIDYTGTTVAENG